MSQRDPLLFLGDSKRCSKCRKYKPGEAYHKGYSACKECRSKSRNKYHSDQDRFWSRVTKQTEAPYCWIWGIPSAKNGPKSWWRGRHVIAQHVAYELTIGLVPDRGYILMECDNRRCVNPAHMRAVTPEEYRAWLSNKNSDRFIGRERPGIIPQGESHPHARFTEADIRFMRTMAQEKGIAWLAHEFNARMSTISNIVHFRTWKHAQ